MELIKIIVVDDHEFFKRNFIDSIQSIERVKVVAEASNGLEFLDLLKKSTPDLVFMDVKMPVMDGIEAIKRASVNNQNLKCIALTMYKEKDYLMRLIGAGAKGILFKNATLDEIELSMKKVLNGEMYFTDSIKDVI